mmetsp:Transcript_12290/g.31008  ORF Transcript_12290/g.31008 Transcript_12290/m.31008 type:complete len:95 (+) Transcript_12290:405-689(+)
MVANVLTHSNPEISPILGTAIGATAALVAKPSAPAVEAPSPGVAAAAPTHPLCGPYVRSPRRRCGPNLCSRGALRRRHGDPGLCRAVAVRYETI